MNRPTVTCTVIAKNEAHNVRQWHKSIEGCFDEIVFVDTGSTDDTVKIAEELGCKVYHFPWINDFSAARNFALAQVKTDFACWMDLDDVLDNKEGFIKFRDSAMAFADMWLATYHYVVDQDKNPVISFARERVFRMSRNPKFSYFIHEGVKPGQGWLVQYITTWSIKHLRTDEDMRADRSRNINIMEQKKDQFDGRLHYYYGKELFEAGQHEKALQVLIDACARPDIELHDRMLGIQFACYAATAVADKMKPEHQAEKLVLAIQLAHQGLQLDPNRAEYHCIIGEAYLKMNEISKALPYFAAAEHCKVNQPSPFAGAIYKHPGCYEDVPKIQKSKIYFHRGEIELAEKEAKECLEKYKTEEAKVLLEEISKVRPLIKLDGPKVKTDDIVITCPPVSAYEFDEDLYKQRGMGGSETACIEMAIWLKKLTGRPVKVFNMRERDLIGASGVEWISNKKLNEYMSKYEPSAHIAWRHNIKITSAPTYLWCHDLITPTVEANKNFDYHLCLSEFHKRYVMAMQGVPEEKIIVTRNGIAEEKFLFDRPAKNPNKIVFMSSPDRGLDRAMLVCDELIKKFPDIELHVYYGLENLYKYGLGDLAEGLKVMMASRPYVKYHGFTEQKEMYRQVSDAVLWLHPCNFIETYCITAIEMLALGVFPVTRRLGGLENTLKDAEDMGHAVLLDHDCVTPEEIAAYADAGADVLRNRRWEDVTFQLKKNSWESVATDWLKFLPLKDEVSVGSAS